MGQKFSRPRKCRSVIQFSDDFHDNPATFRCGLLSGHWGDHTEEGLLYGTAYRVSWAKRGHALNIRGGAAINLRGKGEGDEQATT